MATFIASTLADIQNSGQHGNASVAHCKYTLAANAIGDKVQALKLFAGTKITDVRVINAALGASTTLSVGYENQDGTAGGSATAFINAGSTVSAGRLTSNAAPLVLTKDVIINFTVGGGAATGQVDLIVEYDYRGT